ncbi:hypothetical protein PFISCL1PPCAC_23356, partial [Pristionchus fissidentatus]
LWIALMMRRMRPADDFAYNYNLKYASLNSPDNEWFDCPIDGRKRFAKTTAKLVESAAYAITNFKREIGLQAMIELHEHLGNAETYCVYCQILTGGREEFYAHLVSSFHMNKFAKEPARFDLFTLVVNVYRKDLV